MDVGRGGLRRMLDGGCSSNRRRPLPGHRRPFPASARASGCRRALCQDRPSPASRIAAGPPSALCSSLRPLRQRHLSCAHLQKPARRDGMSKSLTARSCNAAAAQMAARPVAAGARTRAACDWNDRSRLSYGMCNAFSSPLGSVRDWTAARHSSVYAVLHPGSLRTRASTGRALKLTTTARYDITARPWGARK